MYDSFLKIKFKKDAGNLHHSIPNDEQQSLLCINGKKGRTNNFLIPGDKQNHFFEEDKHLIGVLSHYKCHIT